MSTQLQMKENSVEEKYLGLLYYYRTNPIAFIRDILEVEPTKQQIELITNIANDHYVSCKAGHGVGKSSASAMLAFWFMCTRAKPIVIITSPSSGQIKTALWTRIAEYFHKVDTNPLFAGVFDIFTEYVVHKQYRHEWYIQVRTARKENASSLQGTHAENLLFIIDEAAGVDDIIYQTILGSFTQPENYCLQIGNPTRLSGYFFDTHHTKTRFKSMTLSSLDSPLVSPTYIQDMARYGKSHPMYLIRVLGEYPSKEDTTLIDLGYIEDAVDRKVKAEGDVLWGVDPARFGDDETAFAARQGNKLLETIGIRKKDTMEVAGWIINKYNTTEKEFQPKKIMVDTIGVGAGVYDRLKEQKLPVVSVNVGRKASDNKKFNRLRDELWDKCREWFTEQEPDIPADEKGNVLDKDLVAQLSSIRFSFDSSGRLKVEKKEDYKKRNPRIGSPDRADALCLTFANLTRQYVAFIPLKRDGEK